MRVAILDTKVGPIDQSQVLKVDTKGNGGYVVFFPPIQVLETATLCEYVRMPI